MDRQGLSDLMTRVRSGDLDPDDAVAALRALPFTDLGFARVDHHRHVRQGIAEAVYGPGKSPTQCAAVVGELLASGSGPVVLTRVDEAQAAESLAANPGGQRVGSMLIWRPTEEPQAGSALVVTAGTADLAVADECAALLDAHGHRSDRLNDVGVAGIHRLLGEVDRLQAADVVVVVAGMEGALASVVGGLVAAPVIAVPTSVGYGAALEGVTALLGMMASCASGITVVGIDNGFGAGVAALRYFRSASDQPSR